MRRFMATIVDDVAIFDESEVSHMIKVNRLTVGDDVIAQTRDAQFVCRLTSVTRHRAEGEVLRPLECESNPNINITLYMAYTKSESLELVAQKATELGLSTFVPYFCTRCVKRPDGTGADKHRQRMLKISREALKQCGRVKPLDIEPVIEFEDLLKRIPEHALMLYAYEESDESLKEAMHNADDIALIIGPEGGFTPGEAEQIISAGGKSVSLGKRILRAETAAIALLSVVGYETGC